MSEGFGEGSDESGNGAPVERLREQLRERGYLSHGIERWFALDPWSSRASSRAFWLELATVAAKAALLLAVFAALPPAAIMLFRNHPLTAVETLAMLLAYGVTALAGAFAFIVLVALILKLRPQLAVDTPRALLGIALAAAAVLTAPIALWWYRFDAAPSTPELVAGGALVIVFFLVATIVVSAALLSFSIYELQRIPAIHARPRGVPMAIAAALLLALLFLPAYAAQERHGEPPVQIVTTPSVRRVALVAVDGLTFDLLRARGELLRGFATAAPLAPLPGDSTTERWASVGTGVPASVHGVRAIYGIRLAGGRHVVQTLSRDDVVLRDLAPAIGLGHREPLPPTVRRRDFVWEVFAGRGVPSLAVNWWTTADAHDGALESIGQQSVFTAGATPHEPPEAAALRVDATAASRTMAELDRFHPQFATVYLPALDVILNRLSLDAATKLAASVRALDGIQATVDGIRRRGYDVVVVGLPGDRQKGLPTIASTFPLSPSASPSPYDVAPTLAALEGFPLTSEMPGRPLVATADPARIATYGPRAASTAPTKRNDEYYENLRSLGYIR